MGFTPPPTAVKVVLLFTHAAEFKGCIATVAGEITVNVAQPEVAGGAQEPETTSRYEYPFIAGVAPMIVKLCVKAPE